MSGGGGPERARTNFKIVMDARKEHGHSGSPRFLALSYFGLSDEAREIMRNYVVDLQNWMAGILNWHQEVDRYKAEYLARRAHGFLPDRAPAVPVLS